MNNNLRRTIFKSKLLSMLVYKLMRIKNSKFYDKEINRRAEISIFDIENIAADLPYCPTEYIVDNNLYGIGYWYKKHMGITHKLDAYIEHGLFLGSLVKKDSIISYSKSIITFGITRKKHIEDSGCTKNIILIGPYIHYAKPLLSSLDFQQLKKKLGKTLLVFPSHSAVNLNASFENDIFIKEIDSLKEPFNTVLICLYYVDARNKSLVDSYLEKGYKVTTAGHFYDINFLARLKSIIELSDYTMSNSPGTHVGYCKYLKKGHYVFSQKVTYSGRNLKNELSQREDRAKFTLVEEQNLIKKTFSHFDYGLNSNMHQDKIIEDFWGESHIKDTLM